MTSETTAETKSRILSVRLSEKEHIHCHELCTANGIRTVSELARAAIRLLFANVQQLSTIQQDDCIDKLEWRVHMLSLEIIQLRNVNNQTAGQAAEHTDITGSNQGQIRY